MDRLGEKGVERKPGADVIDALLFKKMTCIFFVDLLKREHMPLSYDSPQIAGFAG